MLMGMSQDKGGSREMRRDNTTRPPRRWSDDYLGRDTVFTVTGRKGERIDQG